MTATEKTPLDRLREKLHPRKVRMGDLKAHAMIACLLGQSGWVSPEFAGITCTSDGFLLGRLEGDCGYNEFLGDRDGFAQELGHLADQVKLDAEEKATLLDLVPNYEIGG